MGGTDEGFKASPRVLIRVMDPGECPVLVVGGRMVYAHPELVGEESDRICAQALATLAPAAAEIAHAGAQGRGMSPLQLTCPVEGCGARFELRQMLPEETIRVEKDAIKPTRRRTTDLMRVLRSDSRTITRRIEAPGKTAPFLSRLDPDVVREIVGASTVRRFPERTVFIEEGQEGEALYIVGEGNVEVLRYSDDGREVVLAVVGKGQCLGEMSLLTDNPATATVRTQDEGVVVLELPKADLERLLEEYRSLSKEFSRIIADRLYSMNVKLETEAAHGLAGHLSMIGVTDLVQTLHASRRTGTLTLHDGSGREALVGFHEGEVVAAMLEDTPGPEAFYQLVPWTDGDFSFEGGEPQFDETGGAAVSGGTMGLLMEGLRRLDEKGVVS